MKVEHNTQSVRSLSDVTSTADKVEEKMNQLISERESLHRDIFKQVFGDGGYLLYASEQGVADRAIRAMRVADVAVSTYYGKYDPKPSDVTPDVMDGKMLK